MSKPRSPLFWILTAAGVGLGGCCVLSMGVMMLGALADDPVPGAAAATPSGDEFLIAGEIARGSSMNQALPGGRWVAQYGSSVDHVVASAGTTAWVRRNTAGSLYELVFDEDGTYVWNWASTITMYGHPSQSHCKEKGTWTLSGTQLTLHPESQQAVYSNQTGSQEKSDEDLRERAYQVFDLSLETLESAGAPKRQLPGVMMIGPKAEWDTAPRDQLDLTLQRLGQ